MAVHFSAALPGDRARDLLHAHDDVRDHGTLHTVITIFMVMTTAALCSPPHLSGPRQRPVKTSCSARSLIGIVAVEPTGALMSTTNLAKHVIQAVKAVSAPGSGNLCGPRLKARTSAHPCGSAFSRKTAKPSSDLGASS